MYNCPFEDLLNTKYAKQEKEEYFKGNSINFLQLAQGQGNKDGGNWKGDTEGGV